jgi:hypothetical protein
MNAGRKRSDQLLGGLNSGSAERLLVSLANADFDLPTRLRAQTQKYWPDLWEQVPGSQTDVQDRALGILHKIRYYLQQFWEAQDPHAKDWYIYRAREWFWLSRLHQLKPDVNLWRKEFDTAETAERVRAASSWLNIWAQDALDKAPERTAFEESLFHLQRIAGKTRRCPNPTCQAPYFIAVKKGQKFCSPECARPTLLASKRNYWNRRRNSK